MIPEIEFFIENFISEENKDSIKNSFSILEELGVEDYTERFITLMMMEGDIESAQLVDSFKNTINSLINDLLIQHGVELMDSVTLDFKNKVLEGLVFLPDYEDKEGIFRILETDQDEIEKFTELLTQITPIPFMELFTSIESINPDIFTKLNNVLKVSNVKISNEDLTKQFNDNKIIDKLKLIKSFIQYDNAIGFTLVNNGTVLGSIFTQYTDYAVKQFELLSPENVAKEVFVLLTLADEGLDKPLITFRKFSQNLFTDLDRITKVDIQLNKLIMAFDKFVLQNQSNQLIQS